MKTEIAVDWIGYAGLISGKSVDTPAPWPLFARAAAFICLLCSVVAMAQVPPQPAASASNGPPAAQALDLQIQGYRQQLAETKDGAARYLIHEQIINALFRAPRVGESLKAKDDALQDKAVPPGRRSLLASDLALSYALMHDFPKSQRAVQRAKQLAKETSAEELETLPNEPSYAFLQAEAELARSMSGRHDISLAKTRERSDLAWSNFSDASLSAKRHRAAANELIQNVGLHVLQLLYNNRREEALSYITLMQQRIATISGLGVTPVQAAFVRRTVAVALSSHDDYDAAMSEVNAAITAYLDAGGVEHESGLGLARRLRLLIALAQGSIQNYATEAVLIETGRQANPVLAGSYSRNEAEALIFATRGQWADAAARITDQANNTLRYQGSDSPWYKLYSAMRLLYRFHDPAVRVSESEIDRFVSALATSDSDWLDGRYRGAYVEDGALAASIDYLIPGTGVAAPPSAVALAFRIAELLRASSSQGALADGAARLAAADPDLRALVEQEQALRFEQATSRRALAIVADRIDRVAKQGGEDELVNRRRLSEAADKEKTLAASNARLAELRRQIAVRFPVYRELISPRIPTAAAIGSVLRPGEAYVDLYAGTHGGYAFVVRQGGALSVQRIESPRAETRKAIAALRAPFDASRVPDAEGDLAGFDLAASHALYKTWIEPIRESLQGAKTIYISGGGVLSNVPWNTLVTEPALTLEEARWWVGQVTPVQMPSGSSLVLALGQRASKARQPMVAFADPSFDGREHAVQSPGTRTVRQQNLASDAMTRSTIDYRKIAPLPETLDEVNAISAALGAGAGSIKYGVQASRTRVMQENLSDARVVAFATHGMLPGQVPGMMKAGLALAYEGKGLDDSVLTIDDIVGLRLDADWVVLSACNTGYASGNAGDSMSALLRGFFAAGARTVLATQWAVESESAKLLTVQTFKTLAGNAAVSKADALVGSQRDMIAGKFGALYRHPYFWAPYFLAGNAAR